VDSIVLWPINFRTVFKIYARLEKFCAIRCPKFVRVIFDGSFVDDLPDLIFAFDVATLGFCHCGSSAHPGLARGLGTDYAPTLLLKCIPREDAAEEYVPRELSRVGGFAQDDPIRKRQLRRSLPFEKNHACTMRYADWRTRAAKSR